MVQAQNEKREENLRRFKKSSVWEWLRAILYAFLIFLVIRTFFFEAFTIPTSSMEKSLLIGDYVIVNKLPYGGRIPMTPISFPFSHQTLPFTETVPSYVDWIKFPYWRMWGFSEIKRNDVVVFNYPKENDYPVDQKTHFIKRCVALPGDTLIIIDKNVIVNGHLLAAPEKAEFNYIVQTDSTGLDSAITSRLGITEGGKISNYGHYSLFMTRSVADSISKIKNVKSVKINSEKPGNYSDYVFPHSPDYKWNVDNCGPLKIPRKGDSVLINNITIRLYDRIIAVYEKNELKILNDTVLINGKITSYYKFKMNYYWMMGDNRHQSEDSRFWGFVPEGHIVGRAWLIIFSIDRSKSWGDKIRWSRCFSFVK